MPTVTISDLELEILARWRDAKATPGVLQVSRTVPNAQGMIFKVKALADPLQDKGEIWVVRRDTN